MGTYEADLISTHNIFFFREKYNISLVPKIKSPVQKDIHVFSMAYITLNVPNLAVFLFFGGNRTTFHIEMIHMKYQILFSQKNKRNNSNLLCSAVYEERILFQWGADCQKYIASFGSKFYFQGWPLFRRGLVCSKANKKSQKLSPL